MDVLKPSVSPPEGLLTEVLRKRGSGRRTVALDPIPSSVRPKSRTATSPHLILANALADALGQTVYRINQSA
jgi:hypothetical protein